MIRSEEIKMLIQTTQYKNHVFRSVGRSDAAKDILRWSLLAMRVSMQIGQGVLWQLAPVGKCCHDIINTLRPRQNGRHFADDIFKFIFLNENAWGSFNISLKFVPKVRIKNIPILIHKTAWHRTGAKPLSEPMMVSLLTHICVTRPQWFEWIA